MKRFSLQVILKAVVPQLLEDTAEDIQASQASMVSIAQTLLDLGQTSVVGDENSERHLGDTLRDLQNFKASFEQPQMHKHGLSRWVNRVRGAALALHHADPPKANI